MFRLFLFYEAFIGFTFIIIALLIRNVFPNYIDDTTVGILSGAGISFIISSWFNYRSDTLRTHHEISTKRKNAIFNSIDREILELKYFTYISQSDDKKILKHFKLSLNYHSKHNMLIGYSDVPDQTGKTYKSNIILISGNGRICMFLTPEDKSSAEYMSVAVIERPIYGASSIYPGLWIHNDWDFNRSYSPCLLSTQKLNFNTEDELYDFNTLWSQKTKNIKRNIK